MPPRDLNCSYVLYTLNSVDPYGQRKRRQLIVEEMLTHSHDKCYLHF